MHSSPSFNNFLRCLSLVPLLPFSLLDSGTSVACSAVCAVGASGEPWDVLAQTPVWQGAEANTVGGEAGGGVDTLSKLKFGYPTMAKLSTGEVLATFWCYEEEVYCIRWVKISSRRDGDPQHKK